MHNHGQNCTEFNALTQEWTDGLASTIMRRHVADESDDKKWTVWDGPIDHRRCVDRKYEHCAR